MILNMVLNRMYFLLKPGLPWSVRMGLRRLRARRRKIECADVWPIDPRAGNAPAGWPGWPGGKRFALVLSHDVEGSKGLGRVDALMSLELRHGVRSTFNFVPEGEYRLPDDLRSLLDSNGFEVGVHGLSHDGKLYSSKVKFAERAARIREYLKRWGSVGFRSPLMQHKLSWLHELGVQYDASTFDTDPFEPEPDGVGTIFPFWVPGKNDSGYVELPYTLVQDFTLFRILCEPNIDVWKNKLDWIAEHGGMALLNTHPDYMCFSGSPAKDEFPAQRYEEFLSYIRQKYEGQYWSACSRDVATYYRQNVPLASRNTRRKVCMVAYTSYEFDNRVRRYAETLTKRGDHVDVIALAGGEFRKPLEEIDGVTLYRIQHREFDERSKWTYAWRLLRFLWNSARTLSKLHERNRYDVIHVHNMPDFLVFSAWYPKLAGAKVILDIHDVVPELFASKFGTDLKSPYVGLLRKVEKLSAAFSDHVIVSNHLWQQTLLQRSVPAHKCSVFLNHVDPDIFYPRERTRKDGKLIAIFPGSFQWHQGLDIGVRAFAEVKAQVPHAELHLYGGGGGDQTASLVRLTEELGLKESVKFCGSVTLDDMPQVIADADIGIVPKRADSFGNEAYSTKIMEFMSQGIPVVASQTKIDTYYFGDGVVRFFPSGDSHAMADAIIEVAQNKELRDSLVARGHEYVERNGWHRKKYEYLQLVDSLSTAVFDRRHSAASPATSVSRPPLNVPDK